MPPLNDDSPSTKLRFADELAVARWVDSVRDTADSDRTSASAEVAAVFRDAPAAPVDLDGRTETGVVLFPSVPALNRVISDRNPWRHKVFDAESQSGFNGLAAWMRYPAKLVFPGEKFAVDTDRIWGLHYVTSVQTSLTVAGKAVYVIDYRQRKNPVTMQNAVDELVQIAPRVFLGHGMMVVGDRKVSLMYFTLTLKAAG